MYWVNNAGEVLWFSIFSRTYSLQAKAGILEPAKSLTMQEAEDWLVAWQLENPTAVLMIKQEDEV